MKMDDYITFDMLRNFAGLVTMLVILTQFTKDPVDWLWNKLWKVTTGFPTRYLVFIYAEAFLCTFVVMDKQTALIPAWITAFLNGIIVTLAAMKSYESVVQAALNKIAKLAKLRAPSGQ